MSFDTIGDSSGIHIVQKHTSQGQNNYTTRGRANWCPTLNTLSGEEQDTPSNMQPCTLLL